MRSPWRFPPQHRIAVTRLPQPPRFLLLEYLAFQLEGWDVDKPDPGSLLALVAVGEPLISLNDEEVQRPELYALLVDLEDHVAGNADVELVALR